MYLFLNEKKYLVFSILLFASMLCCLARSSWVAFFVYSFIIFLYLIYKKDKALFKRALLLLLCFILTFVIVVLTKPNFVINRVNTVFNESKSIARADINDGLGSGRIRLWKMAVNAIIAHPLFGYGPSTFRFGTISEQPLAVYQHIKQIHNIENKAHNEFLEIGSTMGIPALIIYVLAIASILEISIKKMFKNKISFILVITIISYLTQAFFNVSVVFLAPIFFFILGISNNEKLKEILEKKL